MFVTVGGRGGADAGWTSGDGAPTAAADRYPAPVAVRQRAAPALLETAGGAAAPGTF